MPDIDKHKGIREWAKRYMEITHRPSPIEKAKLWKDHNSLRDTRPMFFTKRIPYEEFFDYGMISSADEPLRSVEIMLATSVDYRSRIEDDFVFDPWVTLDSVRTTPEELRWGVPCIMSERAERGAARFIAQIVDENDFDKIKAYPYEIDEQKTGEKLERVQDAIGDIIGIHVNRQGNYARPWNMDLITDLTKLLSLETLMLYMYDKPDFLHRLLHFMQQAILNDYRAVEESGGFCLADGENQCILLAHELPDPTYKGTGCKVSDLWGTMAAQELTLVSPAFFKEFALDYQIPIINRYGLSAYGCCENMNKKIEAIKAIPNLRRIAITPCSDIEICSEQIGSKYVASWRPNPTSMIAYELDEDRVRKEMRRAFSIFKKHHCIFDVTLKDVMTIHYSPDDLLSWNRIVRDEVENFQ